MENRPHPIQGHAYTRATPSSQFSPQCDEERINVSPLDVGADWILEKCFEGPGLFPVHLDPDTFPRLSITVSPGGTKKSTRPNRGSRAVGPCSSSSRGTARSGILPTARGGPCRGDRRAGRADRRPARPGRRDRGPGAPPARAERPATPPNRPPRRTTLMGSPSTMTEAQHTAVPVRRSTDHHSAYSPPKRAAKPRRPTPHTTPIAVPGAAPPLAGVYPRRLLSITVKRQCLPKVHFVRSPQVQRPKFGQHGP